ncbi:MAG: hypothetical protein U0R71_07110 [Solirubrobacterales bacterium]
MSHRISKLIAVTGVSAALAVGGAGIAQAAGPNHGGHGRDDACKRMTGKKKQECIKRHEKHHGANHH